MFTAFKVRTCIFCYKNKKHPHPISRDEGIVLPRYHPSSRKKRGLFFLCNGRSPFGIARKLQSERLAAPAVSSFSR